MIINGDSSEYIEIYIRTKPKSFFQRLGFCLSYLFTGDAPFVKERFSRREVADINTVLDDWLWETSAERKSIDDEVEGIDDDEI